MAKKEKSKFFEEFKKFIARGNVIDMAVGVVIFQTIPATLLGLFEASDHMLAIGVPALRAISLSFVFAGFCIICSATFQALGNGVYSMLMSFARQIVVILPVAFIFAKLIGLDAVWYSYPIAEIVSVVMSIFMLKRIIDKKVKHSTPIDIIIPNIGNSNPNILISGNI